MTLRDLAPGESAVISRYGDIDKGFRKHLLTMGLTPGTKVTLVRVAPLGDPIEIKVRGFSLTIRKNEAEHIKVQ